jgi:RNA polymerase sigma factor (sigma-70 family)
MSHSRLRRDPRRPPNADARAVDAFGALYRRHADRVYALARRFRGPDLADDGSQEVFVRAWERLGDFRSEAAFATWLHRVAVTVLLRQAQVHHRRAARTLSYDAIAAGFAVACVLAAPLHAQRDVRPLTGALPVPVGPYALRDWHSALGGYADHVDPRLSRQPEDATVAHREIAAGALPRALQSPARSAGPTAGTTPALAYRLGGRVAPGPAGRRPVAGALLGGATGVLLGGALGAWIGGNRCGDVGNPDSCYGLEGSGIGASLGLTLGAPLGAHLLNGRRGDLRMSLLVGGGIAAVGLAAFQAADLLPKGAPRNGTKVTVAIAVPVAQLVSAALVERRTAKRRITSR